MKLDVFFKKKAEENRSKAVIASNINRKHVNKENYIDPVSQNSAKLEVQSIDVREEVAKAAGVSHFTIPQIKRIFRAASGKQNKLSQELFCVYDPN
ncbi:hypothetical protein [Methanosarcina spelaei]|uniref:hypothetical protein n=1 Tax=Methanosarcina spelaei TaxID=1036679 RepID=UPI001482F5D0|nr:hypothetical protein [Methanosarcina spelaei]